VKLEVTKQEEEDVEDEEDEDEDEDDVEGDDESETDDESDESSSEDNNGSEDERKTDAERRRERALARIQVCCFSSDVSLRTCKIVCNITPSPNQILGTELLFAFMAGSYKIASGVVASMGMLCVCKDNHLLCSCIDIYCSHTLYTGELEELKLAGR
jgi:hypothetical protein